MGDEKQPRCKLWVIQLTLATDSEQIYRVVGAESITNPHVGDELYEGDINLHIKDGVRVTIKAP